ncbi:helix-turn-helix transcriptional regulator [Actinokineospora sp. NBRC 105648]|uniref:helix-turn-helix transcriptional regulator n=1 Tax=Actinokineospora sp. NBRC 105648 TaxID=3032206 RepID=UPI0024A1CEC5|nr:helix-turn-helix transcriptional regulator [Actinokineospora sp. NBRC 105648]GLZ37912.1 transcriptional regulator [Actinokineospora sp. NBRC 105648]
MASRRERFVQRRKTCGLTQEGLAERLGVERSTVVRWEGGDPLSSPQPWLRPKIARVLQLSLDHLDELLADITEAGARIEPAEPVTDPQVPAVPDGVLLPVMVDGRPVLVPLDARTVAASGLGRYLSDRIPELGPSRSPAVTASEWDAMSPLNRRSLLKHGIAATALPALGLDELRQVASAMDDARRYLDGSVVDYFRRQLDVCKRDDGTLGTRKTLPMVLGLLGAVEEHAREVKPDVRRGLLAFGAQTAEFAGWLYRDARDMGRALFWHDRATEWAQEAGDMPMQGYVLLKKAQLAYDEREPLRMLTLAQAVQSGPWSLPKRVRAEAVQQEARAEAMLGASVDAVERKLDQARTLLSAGGAGESSTLGAHYGETLLAMQTAVCLTEVGQPRRAVAVYAESLRENTFSPRDYGFFLSWMAASLAKAGEPDQAASTGLASAEQAMRSKSERTKQELVRVLDSLKPWQDRSAVKELRHAVSA